MRSDGVKSLTAAATGLLMTVPGVLFLGSTTVAASAADQTCQGQPATLVGTPEGIVTGTPGNDVVITNGASSVRTGDGDDTICITATRYAAYLLVDAGAGDDVVDRSGDVDAQSSGRYDDNLTLLGPGADTYLGIDVYDHVIADGDGDGVKGGGGADSVLSGIDGRPNTDRIENPGVGGSVEVAGIPEGAASFTGGGTFVLTGLSGRRSAWDLRADQGRLRFRGAKRAVVKGFTSYEIDAPQRRVRFVGTGRADDLTLHTPAKATMAGGNDRLSVQLGCGRFSGGPPKVLGGTGRDFLEVDSCASGSRVDLEKHFVKPTTSSKARTQLRPSGWETTVVTADKVRLSGSAAAETLYGYGCDVEVRGDDGHDRIGFSDPGDLQFFYRCSSSSVARHYGGNGNDQLIGGPQQKVFMYGGAGRDKARGINRGAICVAEVRDNCRKP